MELRYGVNPGRSARALSVDGGELPYRVLAGTPSYINVLDALNGWQLVRALKAALGRSAAASFKHVSPSGAAIAGRVDEVMADTWGADPGTISALASAYVRARDADPRSSYGDFVAVSGPVDRTLAEVLRSTVNDGIIAPGYEEGTLDVLRKKKRGTMLVLEVDPAARPTGWERRDIFGVSLVQDVAESEISPELPTLRGLSEDHRADAVVGMLTVLYAQSNSVGLVRDGMMIGVGAGQQSRVDCTRIAGTQADLWWLRRLRAIRNLAFRDGVSRQDRINASMRLLEGDLTATERRLVKDALQSEPADLSDGDRAAWLSQLDGVTFVSDGLVPFRDNVDHAARHGVRLFVEPGGSIRSDEVSEACEEHGVTHVQTGIRLFHH